MLKCSEDNILLNYIPCAWNLTIGQWKWIFSGLTMAKRLLLQHWKDKCIGSFIQWIEDLITLATREQIGYRCRLHIDK